MHYDLKGDEGINIGFQRDLTKINFAHYVCRFLLKLHSDLPRIACEHQGIDKVATAVVSKLRTNSEICFQSNKSLNNRKGLNYHVWSRMLSKNANNFTGDTKNIEKGNWQE